ncbi:MAG: hypothetical protein K6F33_14095 [Bacteroidales bacterium]|nr:hypothetical protein [Bacteroidales bacterium]
MATVLQNTKVKQKVSTLDVLWAFYQSQPKKIKVAFRNMLEAQDDAPTRHQRESLQWKLDLKDIRLLKEGWDDACAPCINKNAIANVNKFASTLDANVAKLVRLFPTYLGAVMLKLETEKGRVKCEIGDTQMSYFVKRIGRETEHHSFEDISEESLSALRHNLESIV